jgi:hypothetical protein
MRPTVTTTPVALGLQTASLAAVLFLLGWIFFYAVTAGDREVVAVSPGVVDAIQNLSGMP